MAWVERESMMPDPSAPITPRECRGELAMHKVNFSYVLRPESQVLDGLSLHAAPGEMVALCGPSGGGKSSIIALFARLYAPDAGEVTLDGHPLASLHPAWLRRQVALVNQEPVLCVYRIPIWAPCAPCCSLLTGRRAFKSRPRRFARSIAANIAYGLDGEDKPSTEAVEDAARRANAFDFIVAFPKKFETAVGERGAALSGGQKQRVAIARAIIRKPSVLLLDEATSALDAESEAVVQNALDAMIEAGGLTVIVIAHRLSTIVDATRILVIAGGRVKESGTHSTLLEKQGEYAKLVKRQVHQGGSGMGSAIGSAVDLARGASAAGASAAQ